MDLQSVFYYTNVLDIRPRNIPEKNLTLEETYVVRKFQVFDYVYNEG